MTVFISGSRSIKTLNNSIKGLIDLIIKENKPIIIGDCYGLDCLVQEYLCNSNYENVTVYHIGNIRNNYGFKTKKIFGYRQSNKDLAMARDCVEALAIVKDNSKGTMQNVNRINDMGKNIIIYAYNK